MKTNMRHFRSSQDGITLLITLLVMGLILAISSSLLNITLKQYQIAGIAKSSETAFHAANAGIECALYWDQNETSSNVPRNSFRLETNPAGSTISCFGAPNSHTSPTPVNEAASGVAQNFRYSWEIRSEYDELCTEISVFKFNNASSDEDMSVADVGNLGVGSGSNDRDCPQGITCTVIQSRGYNSSCSNLSGNRTVERELILVY